MTQNKTPREPMFNFGEKVPAYLAGILIAIYAFISLFLPKSLDQFFALYGMLRPLNTPGTDGLSNACLLYTSPSPRDLSTSRMPSSA